MALMNCPECGKEISDQAISCPHCGYPLQSDTTVVVIKKRTPGRGFGIAGMILGIFGVVYSFVELLALLTIRTEDTFKESGVFFGIFFAAVGLLALVFGVTARMQGHKAAKSIAAITLGCITVALSIAIILVTVL